MKEDLKAIGKVYFYKNNVLVKTSTNIVVSVGKNFIINRMKDVTQNVMSHMAIGSGQTYQNIANTSLVAELARVALTSTTCVGNTITYEATFLAGVGTGSVHECAIFNAGSGGTMLARTTFDQIDKTSLDPLKIVWAITIV